LRIYFSDCRHGGRQKVKGTSQKVKRANILLKTDQGWTDAKIAEALNCRTKTVENVRKRLEEMGFGKTLEHSKRATPPVAIILDGEQEAKIIAMRLGEPQQTFRVVELAKSSVRNSKLSG